MATKMTRRRVMAMTTGAVGVMAVGAEVPHADWLLPQSYDVKVTDLRKPAFNADGAARSNAGVANTGPVVSNELPFTLNAGVSRILTAGNINRCDMMLQNLDVTNNLFYSFGTEANANSSFLTPGQTLLLDFITPTNSVWCFATVNIAGFFREFAHTS